MRTVTVRILKDGVERDVEVPVGDPDNPDGFLVNFPQELVPCTILRVNGVDVSHHGDDVLDAQVIGD